MAQATTQNLVQSLDLPPMTFSIVRFVSLLLALVVVFPEDRMAFSILLSAANVHFWFGLYYGFPEIKKAWNGKAKILLLLLLGYSVFATVYVREMQVVTIALFGIHSVFSEAYFGLRDNKVKLDWFIFFRGLFEAMIYITVAFKDPFFNNNLALALSLVGVSLVLFIGSAIPASKTIGFRKVLDLVSCQIVALLAFVLVYFVFNLHGLRGLIFIIFLHGWPWFFYPIVRNKFKLETKQKKHLFAYMGSTLLIVLLGVPWMMTNMNVFYAWAYFYNFWVNVHIMQSFFASYAVPLKLKQLFIS